MKRACIFLLSIVLVCALLPITALAAAQSEMLAHATEPVFMRTGPGTSHDSIVELQTGEAVILQGAEGKWARVRYNGNEGYVFAQYLSDPAHTVGRLYTAKSKLTVYESNSTKSNRIGTIKKGAPVIWYNSGGGWAGIYYGDTIGYVREKYIKKAFPVEGSGTGMAAIARLDKAGWQKKGELIEYFLDGNQNLAIRVTSGADRVKLEKEAAEILGEWRFSILLSSLPKEYNAFKIAKTVEEIGNKVNKLPPAQRELVPLSSWGYSPAEDCVHIGMVTCDEATIANFKKLVGNIPNAVFVQRDIAVPKT